jgi:hypothetical protein
VESLPTLVKERPMPCYFFNVYDDVVAIDEEGVELPDLAAAHEQAIKAARELASAELTRGTLYLKHRIEVEDEDRRPVLTLPFRAAFKIIE